MIDGKQAVISSLILRAYSLIGESPRMAFIGIYSTETYESVALADRENVHINPTTIDMEDQSRKLAVQIYPSQVRAIVRHIQTPDNPLTQINIANLHFVCLRNESGSMTGMSNFNMDTKRESVNEIDETLFSIVQKHYSSEEILEGVHALHISAILKEDFVVIGICRAGTDSSLKILKAVFEEPEIIDTYAPNSDNIGHDTNNFERRESDSVFKTLLVDTDSSDMNLFGKNKLPEIFFPNDAEQGHEPQAPRGMPEVELRRPGLSAEERRSIREKRETSFCEDWRTATVKSIEALRLIGPFHSEDEYNDRDDKSLIDNAESIDTQARPHSAELDSRSEHEEPKSNDAHLIRRPSRATMV